MKNMAKKGKMTLKKLRVGDQIERLNGAKCRQYAQNMTKTATEIVAKWPQNVQFYALFSLE